MSASGEIVVGDVLPGFAMPIRYDTVAATNLASWSFFSGHSDPEFARSQRQRSIYLDTSVLQGFADRIVTDWAGAGTFIMRRRMTMLASVFPGDLLTAAGSVTGVAMHAGGRRVELALTLDTQAERVCDVVTTALLPG